MAQALLATGLPNTHVTSAGTDAMVGQPADQHAVRLMAERGIDISAHRAQQIDQGMCKRAEVILVMDQDQRRYLREQYPTQSGKLFRIGEFTNRDIPDPFTKSWEAFAHALDLIDAGIYAWTERIRRL